MKRVFPILGLAGVCLWLAFVNRPLDHRLLAPWRQADYTQIARNFDREDFNILYPRIDWRGDGPGYVEMEFPFLPWLGAVLYKAFGSNAAWMRLLSALVLIAGLFIFIGLAQRLLPAWGAAFAVAALIFNPQLLHLATAIQPEAAMLSFSILALWLIHRWETAPSPGLLLAASGATALAILAKAPAAYLGLVLAYFVLKRWGAGALARPQVYAAALFAAGPPLAWYLWARGFWMDYGNSLGLSNETHFIGLDILWPPSFLVGIVKYETLGVLTPLGWILALAALRARRESVELPLVAYAAAWIFYLASARTSGDHWAWYYHSLSVPAACLLMGAGLQAFLEGRLLTGSWRLSAWQPWIGRAVGTGTLLALFVACVLTVNRRDSKTDYVGMLACSQEFAQHVPRGESIVVGGGGKFDEYGTPVAYNEPMFFAWMDRKGFSYASNDLSMETLQGLARRGGRYWVAKERELKRDGFQAQASQFRLVDSCEHGFRLYDLKGEFRAKTQIR